MPVRPTQPTTANEPSLSRFYTRSSLTSCSQTTLLSAFSTKGKLNPSYKSFLFSSMCVPPTYLSGDFIENKSYPLTPLSPWRAISFQAAAPLVGNADSIAEICKGCLPGKHLLELEAGELLLREAGPLAGLTIAPLLSRSMRGFLRGKTGEQYLDSTAEFTGGAIGGGLARPAMNYLHALQQHAPITLHSVFGKAPLRCNAKIACLSGIAAAGFAYLEDLIDPDTNDLNSDCDF